MENINDFIKFNKGVNDDCAKLQLERFVDKIDSQNLNQLMTDLMLKYSDLSKRFEEKNQLLLKNRVMLEKYNTQLEELVNEKVNEISESQMSTIFALVKLAESRDDETGDHVERTAELCKLMAICLRKYPKYSSIIDNEYIDNIYKASPLHDIGKVGIPDGILLKKGRLTKDEFLIMKSHVEIGYETLKEVHSKYEANAFLEMGMDITRYHHEKWDGTGYSMGIKGEEIPLSGRIMAIVDVYDALRSKRIYKEAFSHAKSVRLIKENRGKHFDPELVDIFIEHHNEFKERHDFFKLRA